MNIVIEGNDASEYIKETRKALWKYSLRSQYLVILLFFILGLFVFAVGLSSDSTWTATTFNQTTDSATQYITEYDYHISYGLGIGFMLLALYYVYFVLVQQRKYFSGVEKICARHKHNSNAFYIKITTESIVYRDFELFREEKWTGFSHFLAYKGDIFLFQEDYYVSTIVLQKVRLSDRDYSDVSFFLKSRLREKKRQLFFR